MRRKKIKRWSQEDKDKLVQRFHIYVDKTACPAIKEFANQEHVSDVTLRIWAKKEDLESDDNVVNTQTLTFILKKSLDKAIVFYMQQGMKKTGNFAFCIFMLKALAGFRDNDPVQADNLVVNNWNIAPDATDDELFGRLQVAMKQNQQKVTSRRSNKS